jgi:AcrR family transcriptional regulator
MTPEARQRREAQIMDAAYAVLGDKGFGGVSMLAVARRARASNETLYRWYGDKTGLFCALIQFNAAQVTEALDEVLLQGGEAETALQAVGKRLLDIELSDKVVALNRAAAADNSDTLGPALAEAETRIVMPRLVQLFARLKAKGRIDTPANTAATLWLGLLMGSWQLRCVTGAMPAPDDKARTGRVAQAMTLVLTPSRTG